MGTVKFINMNPIRTYFLIINTNEKMTIIRLCDINIIMQIYAINKASYKKFFLMDLLEINSLISKMYVDLIYMRSTNRCSIPSQCCVL